MKIYAKIRHSLQMVGRNKGRYLLLSVTIVLSFSFLLGYMTFMDSSLYNQYKDVFALRRGDVVVQSSTDDSDRVQLMREKLEEMDATISYIYHHGLLGTLTADFTLPETGKAVRLSNWQLYLVPDYAWRTETYYDSPVGQVVWVDGRENQQDMILSQEECLIGQQLFFALGLDKMDSPVYTFYFRDVGWKATFRVAGYITDTTALTFDENGNQTGGYANRLVISSKHWNAGFFDSDTACIHYTNTVIHSETPEAVEALAAQLGFSVINTAYDLQNRALEDIRTQKQTKATITCALLLLLGMNLYSSFSNALNERKFEIGVKRAIGASASSIVGQFLIESMVVMLMDILLSVAIVADLLIIYKYIFERTPDAYGQFCEWIIYVSPYSIGMFGVCAVALTVVFSLIFAYKSTQVEIVQYLKAE